MRLVDRLLSIAIVLSLIEPLYVRLGEQRQSSLDKNLNRGLSDVMNVMSEHLHTTNDWLTPHLASTFSGAKASQVVVLYPAVMILTLVLIRRIKVSRINLLLLIIAVTVGVAFMVGFVMHVMASDLATLRESVIGLGWRVWFGVLCSYAIVRSLAGRGW